MIDLDALESLAKAATPRESLGEPEVTHAPDFDDYYTAAHHAQAVADTAFTASTDPSTVLALIARLRAAELVCLAVFGVVDVTTGAVESDWDGSENWQDVKTALRAYLDSKASR